VKFENVTHPEDKPIEKVVLQVTGENTENVISTIASFTVSRGVSIDVSPSYQAGMAGKTLNYKITVTNTGNVIDTYILDAVDNAGWSPELLPSSLTVPLGSSEIATLSVKIPENAEPDTIDNIAIVVVSEADNTVTAEKSCIAHAYSPLDLSADWNLISFPLASKGDTPDNIFAGQIYYIWEWDAVEKKYISPSPTAPVELGVGYWVYVDESVTAATSGIPVENYSIDLVASWNLVGFPVTNENTTPDNLFAGQTYYRWKWDAVEKKYISPPSNQPVELGVGYWVWVGYDQTVTVPL